MLRREFSGSVVRTTLSANISNSAMSIPVTDGSTFPGGVNPFVIVFNRGLPIEEKVLISSRSGNTLSVSSRAYDGTGANAHVSGSFVDHVLDATTLQDMNTTTYDNEILIAMGS